jgi:hypothetical protein
MPRVSASSELPRKGESLQSAKKLDAPAGNECFVSWQGRNVTSPLEFSTEFNRAQLSVTRRNARRSQVMFTGKTQNCNILYTKRIWIETKRNVQVRNCQHCLDCCGGAEWETRGHSILNHGHCHCPGWGSLPNCTSVIFILFLFVYHAAKTRLWSKTPYILNSSTILCPSCSWDCRRNTAVCILNGQLPSCYSLFKHISCSVTFDM